jgi:hypothetical protein
MTLYPAEVSMLARYWFSSSGRLTPLPTNLPATTQLSPSRGRRPQALVSRAAEEIAAATGERGTLFLGMPQ